MAESGTKLTPAEWHLLECLWEASPRTGREAVEYLEERVGWKRSTTLTLLRRMTEKGLLASEEIEGVRSYYPLVRREEAAVRQTRDFLSRVYKGSVGMMLSAIVERQELTEEEIVELHEILRKAKEAGK